MVMGKAGSLFDSRKYHRTRLAESNMRASHICPQSFRMLKICGKVVDLPELLLKVEIFESVCDAHIF